jgi:AraC-like DNA-binding protein
VTYGERPTRIPGATLWWRTVDGPGQCSRILPDGCLDVIWDGRILFVAGPDTTARWHHSLPGTAYVGLRFSGGNGPALVGTSARELCDVSVPLDELWPTRDARELAERVAGNPRPVLEAWAFERAAGREADPLGPRILAMATANIPVAQMATSLGFSSRQLLRRCLALFGYGPQHLRRVVRFTRAVDHARRGMPLIQVAGDCGYADQAHLAREVHDLSGTTATGLLAELGRG